MTPTVQVLPAAALSRLSRVIGEYASYRRIPAVQALERQGRNVAIRLTQGFMKVVPGEASATYTARSRGFAMGRENDAEAGQGMEGFSYHTLKRARAMMQNYPSILAKVYVRESGRVKIVPVSLGAMNRRTGLRKRVKYRAGKTLSVSGRKDQRFAIKAPDEKVLNFRAVATVMEMNLRESGRRYLAVSFLYRRWRKIAPKDRVGEPGKRQYRRLEEVKNMRSRLGTLGEAVLTEGAPGEVGQDSLRLTSFVPGVAEVGQSRGIFAAALEGAADDMVAWMREQEAKRLGAAIGRALLS